MHKPVLMLKLIPVRTVSLSLSLVTVCAAIASGVKISIHGDEEEARSFTGEWLNNGGGRQSEDDSDSDMDTKTESSSRRVLTAVF